MQGCESFGGTSLQPALPLPFLFLSIAVLELSSGRDSYCKILPLPDKVKSIKRDHHNFYGPHSSQKCTSAH